MAKTGDIIETKIDRFDGGIVNDARHPAEGVSRMIQNFDIYSNPRKMSPYRNSETGDSLADTFKPQNFLIALLNSTPTYRIYSLGQQDGLARAQIRSKAITTGAANDLDDGDWSQPANANAGQATPAYPLFVYYRKTGLIYGAHTGTHIWAADSTFATAFQDTHLALTYTNIVANGVVHPHDDILYIPYDNKIARNDNGTWTSVALTLPAHLLITSITPFGRYLAIAAEPLDGVGNSQVFFWSREISTNFLEDSIDWGAGRLRILEELDGHLIGISAYGGDVTRFSSRDRIAIRVFKGVPSSDRNFVYTLMELVGDLGVIGNNVPTAKQKIDGRLFFLLNIDIDGVSRDGLWSIGRPKPDGPFVLVNEHSANNDTAVSTGALYHFIKVGDFTFIAFTTSGAVHTVSKTNDTATYTATATYISKIYDAGDASLRKSLLGISIMTEFLPTGSTVSLGYWVDNESRSNTPIRILRHTTENDISKSAVNLENITAGGDTVTITIASPAVVTLSSHGFGVGQQIKFSTTGALPTGITAGTTYYVISTGLATNTFQFSATSGGSAVNTSGSQSGTHTVNASFPLPKDYKEIQFRITSTGANAEITGFSFKERIEGKRSYT